MQIFFSHKAIDKLKELGMFHNMILLTSNEVENGSPHAFDQVVLRTNEADDALPQYSHKFETHVGPLYASDDATKLFGTDNRIDFDEFRQVFVFLRDGQMIDDNLYLQNKS
ncbi:MAG: iron-sulfur cluster biosynthesis family protein [Aerococcus sp.]|nr:iron-sulfur cluster biosynthesis family protein [Aerococcus sp.]